MKRKVMPSSKSVGNLLFISITLALTLLLGTSLARLVYAEGKNQGVPELNVKVDTIIKEAMPRLDDDVQVAKDCCERVEEFLQLSLTQIFEKLVEMDGKLTQIEDKITSTIRAKHWIAPYAKAGMMSDSDQEAHTFVQVYSPTYAEGDVINVRVDFKDKLGNIEHTSTSPIRFPEKVEDFWFGSSNVDGYVRGFVEVIADKPVRPAGYVSTYYGTWSPDVAIHEDLTWYPVLDNP